MSLIFIHIDNKFKNYNSSDLFLIYNPHEQVSTVLSKVKASMPWHFNSTKILLCQGVGLPFSPPAYVYVYSQYYKLTTASSHTASTTSVQNHG